MVGMSYVLINNEVVEREFAKIDIEDRGNQFGDGIYEVIRVYEGKCFALNEHMERLYECAEKINIHIPFSSSSLKEKLLHLLQKNEIQDGIIYLQVSRGVASRQHHFPQDEKSATLIAYTSEKTRPLEQIQNGASAKIVEDIRWLRCDIKSLNLLGSILAKQEAHAAGALEAIMHRDGTVTEGSSSNCFAVIDGVIYSHPVSNLILNGITRRYIVEICKEQNVPLKEQEFTLDALRKADEVFIASTTAEITPITQIDGVEVGNGLPGLVTKALQEHFEAKIQDAILNPIS